MRIVQFISSLGAGGAERQFIELLKGLSAIDGVNCEVIIMSEDIHYTFINKLNIKVHFLVRNFQKDPFIFYRLFCLCKKIEPDILHSWESMCSVYAMPVTKLLGIKFVNGFLRNAPPNFSFREKKWLRAKITFPFSDAIVSNSFAGLRAFRVSPTKGYFVHNGFDMVRITNLSEEVDIRKNLGVGTDKIVGMVAQFSNKKDHNTFIRAAQKILATRNDVSFLMIGDGENIEKCKDTILPQFRSQIKFLGKKKQIEEIVNIFSVGVLSTNASVHGEGISNSIMEYMALAKPVIATKCGGNNELVNDGETGYLVGPGDSNELASVIIHLLDNPNISERLGKEGRKKLQKEFSLEKMTKAYIDIYRLLLEK